MSLEPAPSGSSRARRLVLVSHRAVNDHADLERIARSIERDASDLRVSVLRDKPHWLRRARIAWQPTLVYSAKALRRLRPLRGAVLQGSRQSDRGDGAARARGHSGAALAAGHPRGATARCHRLWSLRGDEAGPRRVRRRRAHRAQRKGALPRSFHAPGDSRATLDRAAVRPYGQLADCAARADLVRHTALRHSHAGGRSRAPIRHAADFGSGGRSIVASHVGCSIEFCHNADILALAERAARVFPDIPLLGVDILRDADSGQLHVVEVNSRGGCWGFSSRKATAMQQILGRPFESQFDAFARAPRVLIEETRLDATARSAPPRARSSPARAAPDRGARACASPCRRCAASHGPPARPATPPGSRTRPPPGDA